MWCLGLDVREAPLWLVDNRRKGAFPYAQGRAPTSTGSTRSRRGVGSRRGSIVVMLPTSRVVCVLLMGVGAALLIAGVLFSGKRARFVSQRPFSSP